MAVERVLLAILCVGAHGALGFHSNIPFNQPKLLSRHASRSLIAPLRSVPLGGYAAEPMGFRRSAAAPSGTFRRQAITTKASADSQEDKNKDEDDDKLPPTVLPICLGVFVQMLGEGIAISSIPLHLKSFGATAVQVGLATSAFSVAQMVCCPLIVKLSSRIGRTVVLRMCLAGATAASFVITLSPTINGVILGRFLAGIFAASVPVAQAGVTDLVAGSKSALALSRVASANQMGIVIGPAMSAVLAYLFGVCGLAAHLQMRAVFFVSGLFALAVLVIDNLQAPLTPSSVEKEESKKEQAGTASPKESATLFRRESSAGTIEPHPYAQLMLRSIALVIGWSLTLSVSTYCLFGNAVMGWQQPQLSATFSSGAAITVFTQLFLFPRLVKKLGDHVTCTAGLLGTATGLIGCSTVLLQPFHSALYLLNRMCSGITDTATATLVSSSSNGREQRSQNLALIQSTRAGARIVTPVLSGSLFEYSNVAGWWPAVGSLPYVTVATLALLLMPLPSVLKRHDQRQREQLVKAEQQTAGA